LIVDLRACNQANLRANRIEDPLTQNTLSTPLNIICEGYGCFKKAATKINVQVGQLGTIPLDLCADCVKKFDVTKNVLEQVEEPFSNTNQNVQPVSIQGVGSRQ
jgi:hypothetical protein